MFRLLSRRWLVLFGALSATVVAAVWPRDENGPSPEVVGPPVRGNEAAPSGKSATPAAAALPPLGERLERPQGARKVEDLFGSTSWTPPPASAARVETPVPTAPPFPYAISGSLADKDGLTVVFMKQNQHFVVRLGEVLEGTYRVDAIDADSITLTYLPLGLKQSMPLGAPQ